MTDKISRTLSNGISIPPVGYGTYLLSDSEAASCVLDAISDGYRLIDGASFYQNEKGVGEGLKEAMKSGIPRSDLFVTSKVWKDAMGYEKTMASFEKTLDDLGLDYLDLYLIHWPSKNPDLDKSTWQALIELYKAGKVRAIGVSNFEPEDLMPLFEMEIVPMADQIMIHPGYMQKETTEFCHVHGIQVIAWSPLGRGRILENHTLQEISQQCGKTVAQVCLRWEVQHGFIPVPKSSNPDRIKNNFDIFDFELSDKQMAEIDSLPLMK